jgi:Flp pilus assembly protein protease CpaA
MWGTLYDHPMPALRWGVVLATAALASAWDVRHRRIPNLLTAPVLFSGLGVAAVLGGAGALLDAALGAAIAALPFVVLFAFAAGGAGDAKLMAALGAWLGSAWGSVGLVLVCLSGVLLGLLRASRAAQLDAVLANVQSAARGLVVPFLRASPSPTGGQTGGRLAALRASMPATQGALTMPYGVAIFAGMLLTGLAALLWNAT